MGPSALQMSRGGEEGWKHQSSSSGNISQTVVRDPIAFRDYSSDCLEGACCGVDWYLQAPDHVGLGYQPSYAGMEDFEANHPKVDEPESPGPGGKFRVSRFS